MEKWSRGSGVWLQRATESEGEIKRALLCYVHAFIAHFMTAGIMLWRAWEAGLRGEEVLQRWLLWREAEGLPGTNVQVWEALYDLLARLTCTIKSLIGDETHHHSTNWSLCWPRDRTSRPKVSKQETSLHTAAAVQLRRGNLTWEHCQ